MDTVNALEGQPKMRRGRGPQASLHFQLIKSTTGSDVMFTSRKENMEVVLTAPWDRWAHVTKDFEDDPYLLDAINRGIVETKTSSKMPEPAVKMPDDLDDTQRGWLTSLLYGPYTSQFKTQMDDWRNSRMASTVGAKPRIYMLNNRVLPLVRHAIHLEKSMRKRPDLIADLEKVERFIKDEEWLKTDVQSTGGGS